MTIVVSVEDFPLEQVTKQLNKLVHVIKIVELEPAQSVQRELLLVKVRADVTVRSQVLETVAAVPGQGRRRRARVADHRGHRHLDKISALLRMLEPFGIREMVQSGMVAVGRGPRVSPPPRRPLDTELHETFERDAPAPHQPVRT